MFKRIHSEEGGFTLVELLVTITILAVLFGIVALTLSGVGANAESAVHDAELGVVQSAVDIYMANNMLAALPTGRALVDADVIATGDIAIDAPFAIYLRHMPTLCSYWWTTAGDVTQTNAAPCD